MHQLTSLTQQALYLVLLTAAPPVLMSLVVGVTISVLQATTQIQEQTLSFAPKLIAVFGTLGFAGAWMGAQLLRFAYKIFDQFPNLVAP
ncbi:MAG: type III secretion system export apparatus subunit SctS [Proteobacteria bacterium]|nr:type III secretion system export apparatus subunit SctS [Cystobacterineae bacterium]MCL2258753.1 type III secretion system export apparatus subunit SctS [Cystobacterineae bacterium]MCL2314537.1 type III secretion system export apparatus subunit SctS [Pseudomonadota bacterium]